MKDPYQILGVSRNASEQEIKAAYKALVKKYHPDQYQDNPLAEFAEEKMAEINTAYDAIMQERRNGTQSYSSYDSSSSQSYGNDYAYDNNYGYSSAGFDSVQIRRVISSGNITQAEQMLENVPVSARNAEWNFLKGNVAFSRGWLEEAYGYFSEACRLEPGNAEYNAALNHMNAQRGGYMQGNAYNYNRAPSGADSTLNCLSTLCIADCCCECMGGDLIRCI
ncbi:MAG: J domain-containing protein [Ruminococcus sp.]|nr:J domain-containing protein [Ruminococcus sp.]